MSDKVKVEVNGRWYTVEVEDLTTDPVLAVVDGHTVEVSLSSQRESRQTESAAPTPSTGTSIPTAASPGQPSRPTTPAPPPMVGRASAIKLFTAPMPGTILSIEVAVGDQVVTGDVVCTLEAMKMKQSLRADWSGIVKTVYVDVGQRVLGGDPILELD